MTSSSRNAAVANWKDESEEEKKEYVKRYYGIPNEINDWETIDMMAEQAERKAIQNK